MNEREKLNELSQSFASEILKLQSLLLAGGKPSNNKTEPSTDDGIQACMNAIYSVANNLHNRIDNMCANMYAYQDKHQDGHPYPLLTATHKTNYLKATGMEADYEKPAKKYARASQELAEVKLK